MEHYSIVDQSSPLPRPEADVPPSSPVRPQAPQIMSVSAAIAAANALSRSNNVPAPNSGLRFPGEDEGESLAEMAERDLDAALQLLADRAQYITGASGAAIALRRGARADMLCRASSGSNAPELGTLLSAEFGLSGESVRTRMPLRCDDTERDPRVNREGCRQLGIASVVVMPITSDDQVLGVFELFSGKINAFDERDISALNRLGEMVETAVRLSHTAEILPPEIAAEVQEAVSESNEMLVEVEVSELQPHVEVVAQDATITPETSDPAPPKPAKRPLLWSAALQAASAPKPPELDRSHVPPVLRGLKKCHACGFPVTEGRLLCVECEEKKWRGQLRSSMAAGAAPSRSPKSTPGVTEPAMAAAAAAGNITGHISPAQAAAPAKATMDVAPERIFTALGSGASPEFVMSSSAPETVGLQKIAASERKNPEPSAESPTPFSLSAGLGSSESWLSANKYIIGAILLVAAVVAAIVFLR